MSVILGNAAAVLLVAAIVFLSAREIHKGHKNGSCAGCSGDCAGCHGSCSARADVPGGKPRPGSSGTAERKFAVNGKIVRINGLSVNRE